MNDLSLYRLAVFDFDDTLAIHPSYLYDDDKFGHTSCLTGDPNYYSHSYAPPVMQNLIANLRNECVYLMCLTHESTSLVQPLKQSFLDKWYGPGIELVFTSKPEYKPRDICIKCNMLGIEPCDVLFIDDKIGTVVAARKYGINALTTMQVLA